MEYQIYIVDAFTDMQFGGNQAAVIPLQNWLSDGTMQKIAMENNLSETAFFIPVDDHFHIRWFTPAVEVDLCGHATLATAHILFTQLQYQNEIIQFESRSGILSVSKTDNGYTLDFPKDYYLDSEPNEKLFKALGAKPKELYIGKSDFLLIYDNEEQIKHLQPDFNLLNEVRARGIIVSAKGRNTDYVYRFFAPQSGINEDPATGSAQTTLTPYWSKLLNKTHINSVQLSSRTGRFITEIKGDRVLISGNAITYLKGKITL